MNDPRERYLSSMLTPARSATIQFVKNQQNIILQKTRIAQDTFGRKEKKITKTIGISANY